MRDIFMLSHGAGRLAHAAGRLGCSGGPEGEEAGHAAEVLQSSLSVHCSHDEVLKL